MYMLNRSKTSLFAVAPIALALGASVFSGQQDSKPADHTSHQEGAHTDGAAPTLHSQIAELRAKVARLEAALELDHKASAQSSDTAMKGMGKGKMMGMSSKSSPGGGMDMSGKGKMKMKDAKMGGAKSKMGMSGMKRMRMMGSMGSDTAEQPVAQPSFLPGFPGASHIYHIGATSHFLDHSELFNPSPAQRKLLAQMLEQSALAQSGFERRIAQAEQDLWVLTSAGEPDAAKIESKVKEVAQLQVEQRLAFIQSVGKAAGALSEAQRAALVGDLGSSFGEATPKKDAEHNH